MAQRVAHPFHGARKAKPTKAHRPAIWENILGTVYAANGTGEVRYFDYRWDEARAFAGVDDADADPRLARYQTANSDLKRPRRGQMVLWVKK